MTRSPVWMVARREIVTRMLTKANIVSMLVLLLLIAAGTVAGAVLLDDESESSTVHVALDPATADLGPALEEAAQAAGSGLTLVDEGPETAPAALRAETDDAPEAFVTGDPAAPQVVAVDQPSQEILDLVAAAARSYVIGVHVGELGGDPAELDAALARAVPVPQSLDADESDIDGPLLAVTSVMISLLLFALIGGGSMIAMGVVEEKTSRVVELLLATIRPTQLLAGKILGIGVYGLVQVIVLGGALAASVGALGLAGELELDLTWALVSLIVWFLLGYTLYALLFGGFAALVARQEDIGSVTTPLMFLLFVPFYGTLFVVPRNPDSTVVQVLSQVPFFAPFAMPVRSATGDLQPWEVPLSIGICLVTIPALVWLAAKVYQRGVLHTGGRMRLRDALSSGEARAARP